MSLLFTDFSDLESILFEDGSIYLGQVLNGKRHGIGILNFANGDKYFGEFIEGDKDGIGTYIFANGIKYTGEFKKDIFTGVGTIISNEIKYSGDFYHNEYDGYGILKDLKKETVFVGGFFAGEKDGVGINVKKDSSFIIANYSADEIFDTTFSYINYNNGDVYIGGLNNCTYSGLGVLFKKEKEIYAGEFSNGKFDGFGFLKSTNISSIEDYIDINYHVGFVEDRSVVLGSFHDNRFILDVPQLSNQLFSIAIETDDVPIGLIGEGGCLSYLGDSPYFTREDRNGYGMEFHDGLVDKIGFFQDGQLEYFGISFQDEKVNYVGNFKNNERQGLGCEFNGFEWKIGQFNFGKKSGSFYSIDKIKEIEKRTKSKYGDQIARVQPLKLFNTSRLLDTSPELRKIMIIDIGTNGLPLDLDLEPKLFENWPEIIKISYKIFNKQQRGAILENSFFIYNEKMIITPDIEKITGVTQIMCKEVGVNAILALKQLANDLKDVDIIVAHNVKFYVGVLLANFFRYNIPNNLKSKKTICTMLLGTEFCNIRSVNGLKWPTLNELYIELFNENIHEEHRARSNVEFVTECYFEMVDRKVIVF